MTLHEFANDLNKLSVELLSKKDTEIGKINPNVYLPMSTYAEDMKENFINVIKSIKDFTKDYDEYCLHCRHKVGCVELVVYIDRTKVCSKVKVMKEVEEWDCESLFTEKEEKELELNEEKEDKNVPL